MSFSSRLRLIIQQRQISQSELAKMIGMGKSSVSQYLSGKNIPKIEVKRKIADVLECSLEYLNGETEETINPGQTIKNISVAECARRLGKSKQFVRVALQTGAAPFGFAVKNKTMFSYYISPKKLDEYIGT